MQLPQRLLLRLLMSRNSSLQSLRKLARLQVVRFVQFLVRSLRRSG